MAPPRDPRVLKAFKAMAALGIGTDKVKPVLKKLFKLYEKNWAPIEEENYRVLVDAIFEEEDTQVLGDKEIANEEEKEAQVHEPEPEPERPLKRLRRGGQEGHGSSSLSNPNSGSAGAPLIKPKEEQEEFPDSSLQQRSPELRKSQCESISPQNGARSKGKHPISLVPLAVQRSSNHSKAHAMDSLPADSLSTQRQTVDEGKEPLIPQAISKEKRLVVGGALQIKGPVTELGTVLLYKQKVPDDHALMKPKDEPFIDDMPLNELPIAIIHPDSTDKSSLFHDRSLGNSAGKKTIAGGNQCENGPASSSKALANSVLATDPEESPTNLEIATSQMGEVKISLSCDSLLGRPNLHMPTLDELLKSMEEKCLRSYKILDQNFSVKKLMKDMCDCFLELATDSSYEPQEKLMNVTPCIDLLKKSPARSAFGTEGTSSNGSADGYSLRAIQGLGDLPFSEAVTGDGLSERGKKSRDHESCLAVVPQCQLSHEQLWSLHNLSDMTKGEEIVQIPWLNELNMEGPPSFNYIPRNLVFQNAHVNFTLSQIRPENCCSTCIGDCLTSATPCVCTDEIEHGFAYTSEGLLGEDFLEECVAVTRDPQQQKFTYCIDCPLERAKNDEILEPCKGHLKRKFIKECWSKCGCHKQCGNRVVQRGIRCKLQVFFTPDERGWGLRTLEKLPKGAFVCENVGEIVTMKELLERVTQKARNIGSTGNAYPVLLDSNWTTGGGLKDEEALCLDATFHGNVARFINHRCLDANLIEIPVKMEMQDQYYYHLALFTTREVDAFEELTWDYGIDFDDNDHPFKAFYCRCGSKFCRNMKRPSRSKSASKMI